VSRAKKRAQMKAMEEMRRTLREVQDAKKLDRN
jgi:hypothetical protein